MIQLLLEPPTRSKPPRGAVAWSYRQQQVQGAGPLQGILMVYDAAIVACARKDFARALEALTALRGGLDFEQGGEIAVQLQRLYLYCEEQVRQRKFTECEPILRELREAWSQSAAPPDPGAAGQKAVTT